MGAFGEKAAKAVGAAAAPAGEGGSDPGQSVAGAAPAAGGGGPREREASAETRAAAAGGRLDARDLEVPAGILEGLSQLLDLEHRTKQEEARGDLFDISDGDGRAEAAGERQGSDFNFGAPETPEYSMRELGRAGAPGGPQLEILAQLPGISSGKEAAVDVLPQRFSLVAGSKYRLRLALPFAVDPDATKAKWDKKARTLRVRLSAAAA